MRNSGGRRGGSGPNQNASKASRFKPPDTTQVPVLQVVVLDLISYLEQSASLEDLPRVRGWRTRLITLASETDVAQLNAEADGEPIEDGP